MNNIYYVRLKTGDEVIAEVVEDHPQLNHIILENPLQVEVQGDDEGTQMIFFSRYNPYAKDTSVKISRDNVVIIQTASDVVTDYYSKSVDFCKSYIDKKFSHGIASATTYVDQILKQLAINGMIEETPEQDDEQDEFIEQQEEVTNQKPTVH